MEMLEYKTPSGTGGAEITEKRSRFIGYVTPVHDETAAREVIARKKAEYHDARHNCWCYYLRDGTRRFSDDGEPQGTAGLPMLEVMKREGVFDVCCVVTRYFGGILLGPGGLLRAYSEAAKLALADSGIVTMRLRECVTIVCPYNLQGRVKSELTAAGGVLENAQYGESVTLQATFPQGEAEVFNTRLSEITSGSVTGCVTGTQFSKTT